ncbi:MAG: hypothetical protein GX892_11770 [Thermoanaerobacteraceae bacterium]|nr:hypothetical protein [Thermoanaerobacteraceae bacterium]
MNLRQFAGCLVGKLGEVKGKKAFQKLVYFAQVLGIPLGKAYNMHYYGPYSQEVADEMNELINQGFLNNIPGSYSYFLSTATKDKLTIPKAYSAQFKELIEKFGSMSPRCLEIYATTHFIDFKFKNVNGVFDQHQIIDEIKKAKSPKFSDQEILKAYNDLEKWNLLYKKIKI